MAEDSPITGSRRQIVAALLMCLGLWAPGQAEADDIVVAAASDLTFAIREIIEDFESGTPHTVRLSLGSSGNFFTQIQNGAPFDVYLSADIRYPEQLEAAGLTEPGWLFSYASGRIVVWARNDSAADPTALGIAAVVETEGRLSIANPIHAPYGRAARSALDYYQLWARVSERVVLAENVAQAAQFADTGAADVAIIALSLAVSDPLRRTGRFWEIPVEAHPELLQGGVILARTRTAGTLEAARAFAAWMQSDNTRAILERYGFALPSN